MVEKKEKAEEVEETPKETKKAKKSDATKIAKEVLSGEGGWGTGRERDERLKKAGHDPEEVRKEVYRLRGEAQ